MRVQMSKPWNFSSWGKTGIDLDDQKNLIHRRTGKILKARVEDNVFTGEGHYIEPTEKERKKRVRKVKTKRKTKGCGCK